MQITDYEKWRDGLLVEARSKQTEDPNPEKAALRAIRNAKPMDGLDAAVRMAAECNSPAIRKAVLESARSADPTVRVNMAALLYYLCERTDSEFDWGLRPYFLRFAEAGPELDLVWNELRRVLEDFEAGKGGRRC